VERSDRQWVARMAGDGRRNTEKAETERQRERAAVSVGDELGGGRLVSDCVGGRR
jgi:hypothetical protein